jgi:xanthine/uracil/vitamin C permease (AzgA family)
VTARGSTLARELRGGLATFFTMAYIVILHPLIIGTVADICAAGRAPGQGRDRRPAVHLLDHQRHRRRLRQLCHHPGGAGRARDVPLLLWVVAALFVGYFAIGPIEELLGVR